MSRLLRWQDLAVFVGRLGDVGLHVHHAPALLVALDGPFRLASVHGGMQSCQGAWLPTGFRHRLDVQGRRLAVIYFDPVWHGPLRTAPVLSTTDRDDWWHEAHQALMQLDELGGTVDTFRQRLIAEVIPRGGVLGGSPPDRQLVALRAVMAADPAPYWALPQAAEHAGLSTSRFSHRFTARTGVSWTAYRNWARLLDSCVELAATPQALTRIALDRGYSSAAHFAASFRRSFGITPSQLRGLQPQLKTVTASAVF